MMFSRLTLVFATLLFTLNLATAQYTFPYRTDPAIEFPLLGIGLFTNTVSIQLDRKNVPLTDEEINALDVAYVLGLDRYSTRYSSHRAHQFSNYTALGSMVMPLALLLDGKNRENVGQLSLITLEGAFINAGLINLTKTLAKRPRPLMFNGDVPIEIKRMRTSRYSFFSGHTAVSSYFSFAAAQMHSDLYPDSKHNTTVWVTAAVLPALTGYGRMRAGKHYLTDVLVGYGVGAALGILVPRLHRIR